MFCIFSELHFAENPIQIKLTVLELSSFYSYLSIRDRSDEIPPLMAVLRFVVTAVYWQFCYRTYTFCPPESLSSSTSFPLYFSKHNHFLQIAPSLLATFSRLSPSLLASCIAPKKGTHGAFAENKIDHIIVK